MNGCVDKHDATIRDISRLATGVMHAFGAIQRGRGFSRSGHNGAMSGTANTHLINALARVLQRHQERLVTKHHWATELAGLTESTARSAFTGRNVTLKTLQALASAAGMSVSEMLEYGEPDWETRVRARSMANAIIAELGSADEAAQLEDAVKTARRRAPKRRASSASEPSGE